MQYLDFEQPIADLEKKIEELEGLSSVSDGVLGKEISGLKKKVEGLRENIFKNLTRWQRVQLARHPDRPYTLDYIELICDEFVELFGDRFHADDKAIVGGFARIDGNPVMIIGEGASGGAIGIGMGNEVYMMENTWYSVISPESCSSILWKTWDYKEQAAEVLKLTATDLLDLKVIDGVIPEPLGGAHRDYNASANAVKKQILLSLKRLSKLKPEKLIEDRIAKYSAMGAFKKA